MTYFEDRCKRYGINEKNNYIAWKGDEKITSPVFVEDRKGNIRINYFNLSGIQYKYKSGENQWPKNFYRTRLRNPGEGGRKYTQPKKSGTFPFFTPGVITKYLHKKNIPTLFVTEGEFKAFKAYLCNLDIIGFPSVQGTYQKGTFSTIHNDIQELIHRCDVKNIVFITDADTMTINYAPGKELSNRPKSFYTAIRNFYEGVHLLIEDKHCPLKHAYWCHIRNEYNNTAKGLDDLLMAYPAKEEDIINELKKQHFEQFFHGYHLSESKIKAIFKEFGLDNANNFYHKYKDYIGNREFLFNKSRYQFNGEILEYLRHEDADKFLRVAADWYKIIKVPNQFGYEEEMVIPFKVGEINRDYRKFPDFLDQVPKFDWFISKPAWDDSYKRVENNCFNVMSPLQHEPVEGCCEVSFAFMKHLFDNDDHMRTYHFSDVKTRQEIKHTIICEEEGSQLSVALDMLAIMLQNPIEKLPVLILVSPEEGTGKSTFLFWQQAIYGSNSVILDNERFKMNFNSHYVTKFFVGLDEGFLEIDKKSEKEHLKQIVTALELPMEEKGVNLKFIPNHIHLVICSNDAKRIMYMDENDSRWFVVKVPKIISENPDILKQLQEEIPAWLYYLKNRHIIHPKVSRLWFKKEWMITEQMKIIINNTKPRLHRLIEQIIKDIFLTFDLLTLDMDIPWLTEKINKEYRYKVDRTEVIEYFKEKRKLTPSNKSNRIKIPIGYDVYGEYLNDDPPILYYKAVSKSYHLKVEDWVDHADEIKHILKKNAIQTDSKFSR